MENKIINYFNFKILLTNMQSIKGKKESMLRLLGMVLILIGLLASLIFDYFILMMNFYVFVLLIFIPWFILIILLKLEKDFFVDNMWKLFLLFGIYTFIMIIIGIFIPMGADMIPFIMISISYILLILSWHFALSIFKKEKTIFLIGGIVYCILSVIFRIPLLVLKIGLLLGISALVIIVLGMLLIIIAEMVMKKKGLLNWI